MVFMDQSFCIASVRNEDTCFNTECPRFITDEIQERARQERLPLSFISCHDSNHGVTCPEYREE